MHDTDGITQEKLDWVKHLKNVKRGRIQQYCDEFSGATFHHDQRPWRVPCGVALPCAIQNELNDEEAQLLVNNGVLAVAEGANMPLLLTVYFESVPGTAIFFSYWSELESIA